MRGRNASPDEPKVQPFVACSLVVFSAVFLPLQSLKRRPQCSGAAKGKLRDAGWRATCPLSARARQVPSRLMGHTAYALRKQHEHTRNSSPGRRAPTGAGLVLPEQKYLLGRRQFATPTICFAHTGPHKRVPMRVAESKGAKPPHLSKGDPSTVPSDWRDFVTCGRDPSAGRPRAWPSRGTRGSNSLRSPSHAPSTTPAPSLSAPCLLSSHSINIFSTFKE